MRKKRFLKGKSLRYIRSRKLLFLSLTFIIFLGLNSFSLHKYNDVRTRENNMANIDIEGINNDNERIYPKTSGVRNRLKIT